VHGLLTAGWPIWTMFALGSATLAFALTHAIRAERWSLWCAVSSLAVTLVSSVFLTVVALTHSFAGVAGVDPSLKATVLAKGISEAMNCTGVALVVVLPLWIAPFVVGEVRRARRRPRR